MDAAELSVFWCAWLRDGALLLMLPFAVHAVERTWFYGSLFESLLTELSTRAKTGTDSLATTEVWDDVPNVDVVVEPSSWWVAWVYRLPRWFAELLSCPLCLRRHLAFWLSMLVLPVYLDAPALWSELCSWVIRILFVVGVADLLWKEDGS